MKPTLSTSVSGEFLIVLTAILLMISTTFLTVQLTEEPPRQAVREVATDFSLSRN